MRHTSLTAAWWWLPGGILLWAAAWLTTILTHHLPRGPADALWYTTAVVLVCPAVAVLGARRPAARVWAWFVLLPLVLVLELPVAGLWFGGSGPLEIDIPALAGFLLVAVMGFGNYVGTRRTTAAILLLGALGLLVLPLSVLVAFSERGVILARIVATILSVTAVWIAFGRSQIRSPKSLLAGGPDSLDALWLDFRNTFGIVWAQRIRERINATAAKENWPVRLGRTGFVSAAERTETAIDPATRARVEQTLHWLLRRFVDPEWINRRLKETDSIGKT